MTPDTRLLRQVSPTHWKEADGRPSKLVFVPRENEEGKISVDDGSRTNAAEAHALFELGKKDNGEFLRSSGVIAVKCSECTSCRLSVSASPRPPTERMPENPFHVDIGFSEWISELPDDASWNKVKKALEKGPAKTLLDAAWNPTAKRGWLYQPPTPRAA